MKPIYDPKAKGWRIVYDGHFNWVKRAGLAGKFASGLVFDSWADAMAYLDKCNE